MTVVKVLPGRAVGKLVHIQLAQQDSPGLLKPGGHGAILRRNISVKKPRPGSSTNPGSVEQIFQPHRYAVQRPPVIAALNLRLCPPGCRPGVFRQQGNKGIERRLGSVNASQVRVNNLHRGNFLAADKPGKLPGAQVA